MLVPAAIPAYATVGAVVASRRPRNAVGWLCLALAALVATQEAGWEYAARAFEVAPGTLPAGPVVAWATDVLNFALPLPFALLLLYFPDGRLPSRRWRFLVWAAAALGVVEAASRAVGPTISAGLNEELPNPTAVPGAGGFVETVEAASAFVMPALLLASVASVVWRWRRADGIGRLRLKWISCAGAVVAVSLLGGIASALISGFSYPTALLFGADIAGITIGVPLAIGVAVLRHRLYDIDLVINRALVYGALTLCVVGIYVFVVGYLGALFRTEGLPISLVAAGLVAVLFQPMRERLQRAVDRLMYGERDEPYTVLSRLGQRLEATFAPEAVLPTVVETVASALKVPHAEISLSRGGADERGFETTARHGTPSGAPLVLPLVYGNEVNGLLEVSPRAKGEPFSATDRRLLEDLARQAGAAAYAVRLTADLRRSREKLVLAREEERRRLRRDLHDGVGPQLAALALKIETARNKLSYDAAAKDLLSDLSERARAAIADVRSSVHALRPPALDELGLVPALKETAAQYASGGLDTSVEAPEDLPPLPAAVEVAVYRIAQEAMTNVVRHARANSCSVRLDLDGRAGILRLEIEDDGSGLRAGTVDGERGAGVGLSSMRERAEKLGGTLVVGPAPGGLAGTLVRAELPRGVLGEGT